MVYGKLEPIQIKLSPFEDYKNQKLIFYSNKFIYLILNLITSARKFQSWF